mmetsp:Transcript_62968/g.111902  ORF Transcript_62968/g.111902 Transcript_62968/m.111902 type:complete len:289 (+) Transcript_62968:64-930(+)
MHADAMLAIGVIEPIQTDGIGIKAAGDVAVRRFQSSPDWTVRYKGIVQLRQLGPEAVAAHADAVAECCRSRFVWMRHLALEALATLDPVDLAAYVSILAERLSDTDDEVCWEALSTLKRLDPDVLHRHAGAVLKLLDDPDLDMRLAALSVLGRLQPLHLAPHLSILQKSCHDSAEPVRRRATQLITHLKENVPRMAVTLRTRHQAGQDGSLIIIGINIAGNKLIEMPLDPCMTCDVLRDCIAQQLNILPLQVRLLTSDASAGCEIDGDLLLREVAKISDHELRHVEFA